MVSLRNPNLIAFEHVVELKTIHAAAAELGLTQAAVTKRIKALEGELETNLFLRSRRGMVLTDEGAELLRYCKVTREAEGSFLSQIKGAQRAPTSLTIVGPTSAISTRIAQNCAPIYAKYPYLSLHLRSEDHLNLIELVRRGEADLAIVSPSLVPNEMDSKVLKSDRYLLVGSPKWQGRPLDDILKNEKIIDFYASDTTTFKYLKQFGLEHARNRLFVNENEALIQYFSLGIGFGTLTETVAKPHIDAGRLIALNRGRHTEDPLALTWYPRTKKLPHFEDLVRSIK